MQIISYPLSLLCTFTQVGIGEEYKERINSAFEGSRIGSDMRVLIRGVAEVDPCGPDSINEVSLLLLHPTEIPLKNGTPLP